MQRPESLVIRPPSESRSVLVRVTRGCRWNRCRFCGLYGALGQPSFSARPVDEVKRDIDALRSRVCHARTVFFGDADPLQIGLDAFIEVARYFRSVFPETDRLTCYARASTLWTLKPEGICRLAEAGLNRAHIGLETGDDELMRYHRKGQNRRVVVESGGWLKQSGIEVSYYVLLGLGGIDFWQKHIDGTAEVVNEVNPDFVRVGGGGFWGGGGGGGTPSARCGRRSVRGDSCRSPRREQFSNFGDSWRGFGT